MHPCLHVDEITRLIARELVRSGGRATAVALACCCKSFENPALDALWETQEELVPLLKSLPRDVWDPHTCMVCSDNMIRITFSQPLIPTVIRETADKTGMGPLPGIRSKDANTQRT